jgi:Fe-S cluster biogenesis protein NfuA
MSEIQVFYEATPNPQSMKFMITAPIAEEVVNMPDPASAYRSPLAQKLFGFPWMAGVLIGPNFVTVSKQDWVDWETLADPLCDLIKEHIESGEGVLLESRPETSASVNDDDSPQVRLIKTVLDQEIRPAVAMDGGDIVFHKYEDQILYLHMQGSCAGCPSSTMTLKQGIEVRLKEVLPEIKEVVSL